MTEVMSVRKPLILGIDPGSREIGVAVFSGNELLYYAIKSIRRNTREQRLFKLAAVLDRLFVEYEIDCLAVEEPYYVQQRSSFVKKVVETIGIIAKNQGLNVAIYSPTEVRDAICEKPKSTKLLTARRLVEIYPELAPHFNLPRITQKRYYAMLFDAVAVGLVCVWDMNRKL